MKIIKFSHDISMDDNILKKDDLFIVSDGYISQMKDSYGSNAIESIHHFKENNEKLYNGQDLTNKTILIWRTGGMGDLCFITPNLRHIKETYKNSKIILGCGTRFKFGMMNHPHIDVLTTIPIDYKLFEKCDYYLMFEGIIENNPRAHDVNAYDLFEARFGFSGRIPKEKKTPVLGISPKHLEKATQLFKPFKESKKKIIGLGLRASHIIRSIPPPILDNIIRHLLSRDVLVALMGGKEDKEIASLLYLKDNKDVIQCYKYSEDYRDSIAQISLLDGIIGPDSSPLHIAAAFGKPMVGLYGAFPSKLRLQFYQNASGFDARVPCGPCFLHGIETCEYSDVNTREPICMQSHQPQIIVDEIMNLLAFSSIPL